MSLPSTYDRVDRVQFPSGAYINLNITPSNHKLEAYLNDPAYVNDKHWFGTQSGASYFHFTTYSNKYYWGRNGNEANAGSYSAGYHHIIFNGDSNAIILDGTTLGSGTNISTSSTLWLGRRDSATNFVGSYYWLKLTDKSTGNLVRDCIPAKRKSDSKVGLYDLINNVFYTNSGSGTLTYGVVVTGQENVTSTNNPLTFTIQIDTTMTANFLMVANCRFKVNGSWKNGMLYKKINGAWVYGDAYVKVNGSWKSSGSQVQLMNLALSTLMNQPISVDNPQEALSIIMEGE